MNVGIFLPPSTVGGVFQYALSIADSLIKHSNKFNFKIIHYDNELTNWLASSHFNKVEFISLPSVKSSLIKKVKILFKLVVMNRPLKNETIPQLEKANIQLLIIPFPSLFGFRNNIPYIVSIPDLMHKYYPTFPEYPLREKIIRNIVYKYASKYSILTVVDDKQGIDDLNKFFEIPKEKIRIIPYVPADYIYKYKDMDSKTVEDILRKYNLPEKFLFYPAQFWYHKNHINLTKSLMFIKEKHNLEIPLVLVGSPKESYKKIMNFVNKNRMNNQIIHLGYVSDKEIVGLYKSSIALVFPSLFGPTNIPPLEALVLGTPVVCSNIFSMTEQVGDAGLLFNPFDIEDMAEKIYKIWTDEYLRKELIKKGYERVKDLTLENYARQWEAVIEEALEKRQYGKDD